MKILLIEDDKALNQSLKDYLSAELFDVSSVHSYAEALAKDIRNFDLLILDWNLGDGQGLDLMRVWRSNGSQKPILFLTAKADIADKVLSLESGANDYVTKPFEPRELLARIRVQLRDRSSNATNFSVGEIHFDLSLRKVTFRKQEVQLSKTEYELLYFLARNSEKVFSREELLREVWGYNNFPTTRTVDTHILQLRNKFEPGFFETIHGIGYRLKCGK